MKRLCGLSLVLCLLLVGCDSSRNVFYKRITIDPSTLIVTFHDPIPAYPEPQTDFYWPFYYQGNNCSLDHFDTTTPHQPRIRYNAFNLDPHLRITSRSKYQVVLFGEFGTFFAETTFYYPPSYNAANTNTMFVVHPYANSQDSEPAQIAEAPIPSDAQLAIVSVLRVLKTPTGFHLVAACYSPEGEPLNFSENESVNGDCRLGGSIDFGYASREAVKAGMPTKLPTAAYLASGLQNIFQPTDQPSTLDCVTFHYDHNRHLRQDIYRPGQPIQTRNLVYKSTPEDAVLAPIDDTRPFYRIKGH